MTDFELDPDERDDDFPYDYAYIHEETGRLWPVVLGVTLLIILAAVYVWEDRYTRPPKVETAPKYEWAFDHRGYNYYVCTDGKVMWPSKDIGCSHQWVEEYSHPSTLLQWRGEWDQDKRYDPNNVVTVDGNVYMCLRSIRKHKPPTWPENQNHWWGLLSGVAR
jgi:hypothetical protein